MVESWSCCATYPAHLFIMLTMSCAGYPAAPQYPETKLIGFLLVLSAVLELITRGARKTAHGEGLGGRRICFIPGGPRQPARPPRNARYFAGLQATMDMTRLDMGKLMSEYAGQFTLGGHHFYQAPIDKNVSTRDGEGIGMGSSTTKNWY